MGLVLDSGVLIAAEREARPVSELLARFEQVYGETDIVLSAITAMELEHGLHRAQSKEQTRKRRDYLDTVFAATPVEKWPNLRRKSTLKHGRPASRFRSPTC